MTPKRILSIIVTFVLTGTILSGALAQVGELVPVQRSATFPVNAVGGSGVTGVAHVADFGLDGTLVLLALTGTAAGAEHPAHIHAGSCGEGGGIVYPLESVDGSSGLSVSILRASYTDVLGDDRYVNVHLSGADLATIVACAEVGEGAEPVTMADRGTGAAAPRAEAADVEPAGTEVREEEFQTLRAASFGIFETTGSGVNGQIQITEETEAGSRVIVTLTGIDTQRRYPMAIYSGDCGTGGELVTELNSVPIQPGDTYAFTITDVPFDVLAEGDNYVNVYAAGDDERTNVIACGEVGASAVR